MMDWYLKNLSWIQARDIQLYKELMDRVEPRPQVDWYDIDTMMRPKEWMLGLGPFSPVATIVLYGFGDGEHALHILNRLGREGHLIIVVPDVPELLEMLHIADMEPLLSDARVHPVVIGINNEIVIRYLAGCVSKKTADLAKIFCLPGYDEWYAEGLKFVRQAFRVTLQWIR